MVFAKPRPKILETAEKRRTRDSTDKIESNKAKKRANGQCEVFVVGEGRCLRRDMHTHHLIGGIGRRKRGLSLLAQHKQRVCDQCHRLITGNVLKLLTDGKMPVYTDAYERWSDDGHVA